MGTDKAVAQLGGGALVDRALAILRSAGLSTAVIAGARQDLAEFGPVIEDPGSGPLGGICAGLESTEAAYALFLPVDMPLLPPELLTALLGRMERTGAGITLASLGGFAQTFPVVIEQSLALGLRAELRSGNDGCFSAFRSATARARRSLEIVSVENLVQSGLVEDPRGLPPAFWFTNVNTPNDLAKAEAILAGHHVS